MHESRAGHVISPTKHSSTSDVVSVMAVHATPSGTMDIMDCILLRLLQGISEAPNGVVSNRNIM